MSPPPYERARNPPLNRRHVADPEVQKSAQAKTLHRSHHMECGPMRRPYKVPSQPPLHHPRERRPDGYQRQRQQDQHLRQERKRRSPWIEQRMLWRGHLLKRPPRQPQPASRASQNERQRAALQQPSRPRPPQMAEARSHYRPQPRQRRHNRHQARAQPGPVHRRAPACKTRLIPRTRFTRRKHHRFTPRAQPWIILQPVAPRFHRPARRILREPQVIRQPPCQSRDQRFRGHTGLLRAQFLRHVFPQRADQQKHLARRIRTTVAQDRLAPPRLRKRGSPVNRDRLPQPPPRHFRYIACERYLHSNPTVISSPLPNSEASRSHPSRFSSTGAIPWVWIMRSKSAPTARNPPSSRNELAYPSVASSTSAGRASHALVTRIRTSRAASRVASEAVSSPIRASPRSQGRPTLPSSDTVRMSPSPSCKYHTARSETIAATSVEPYARAGSFSTARRASLPSFRSSCFSVLAAIGFSARCFATLRRHRRTSSCGSPSGSSPPGAAINSIAVSIANREP